MTRLEQLTLELADDVLGPEGARELETLLQSNPAERQAHISILGLEARLRATRKNLDLPASVMERLRQELGESITQRVMSEIRTQSVPERMPERSKARHHWEEPRMRDWTSAFRLLLRSPFYRYASAFAAVVILMGLAFYLYQHNQPGGEVQVGEFAAITGEPALRHPGQLSPVRARKSTPVQLGDRIETGDADKAEIHFKDGTTLRLNFNTTLDIPKPGLKRSSASRLQRPPQVALLAGQVWSKVQKLTNAPRFAIETPVATATVKGTEFGLKLQRSSSSKQANQNPKAGQGLLAILTVREGAVQFSNALGSVEATALTESQATADSAPTEPQRVVNMGSFRLNRTHLAVTNLKPALQDQPEYLVYPVGYVGFNMVDAARPEAATVQGQTAVRISAVRPGSPAAVAGLQAGDVISAINGQNVTNTSQVRAAIVTSFNRPLTLNLQRAGGQLTVTAIPAQRPGAPALPAIPVQVRNALFEATGRLIEAGYQNQIKRGQITEGEMALEQLVRRYPDAAAVHHNLAFLYDCKDEPEQAIRHYQRAIELDPYAALYHFNLAGALGSIGNLERGLQEAEAAARLAPGWPPTAYALSEAYSVLERPEDAVKALDAALQLNPLDVVLWRLKAKVLLQARQPEAALPIALRAVELDPNTVFAHTTLGNIYGDLGRQDEAEAAYRKAFELDPSNGAACINLANALRKRGLLDEAEKLYRKATELEPNDAGAWSNLGGIFFDRGQFAEAEKCYRKALALAPDYSGIWVNLGEVLRISGRLDESEPLLRKAIELEPDNGEAHLGIGLLCAQRGQLAEAEQWMLRANELNPNTTIEKYLAPVYHSQGKLDQEERTLRHWVARNTNDFESCNSLAWHLAERSIKLDEALTLATRAAELAPTNAGILDTLGWVYYQRGELDQAEAWLKKAVDSSGEGPASKDIREHLKKVSEKKANSK